MAARPVPHRRVRRRPVRPTLPPELRPARAVVRRSAGSWTLQSTLHRHGLGPVAGVDEAGRGACAGPLVVAACVLRPGDAKRLDGLTDSKLLTAAAREEYYALIRRRAQDFAIVVIAPEEVDRRGVHVANVEGMRRAVAGLGTLPGYVLTDGFAVRGFGTPALAVPKGDQVAACVAAASVLAKVTRDRIMVALDAEFPEYGFAEHKGYCTPLHDEAMLAHGPSRVHRYSFVNVRAARDGVRPPVVALDEDAMDDIVDDTIVAGLEEDLAEGLVQNGALAVGTSEGAGGGVGP
jgi:ribonuclease HII